MKTNKETIKESIDLLGRYDDQFRKLMPSKDYFTIGSLYFLLKSMEIES